MKAYSADMLNPRNSVSGRNNRPRENGQTRMNHGHLEYLSPLTGSREGNNGPIYEHS